MAKAPQVDMSSWRIDLERQLPLLGHRNRIVVADSAYPAQSNPGIQTIFTEADHFEVLKATLDAIEESRHVRAKLYHDEELNSVYERDAPGVTRYRRRLSDFVRGRNFQVQQHEEIIAKLDESAKLFRVLILKTVLAVPYTSIFIQLDCGYWTSEAEDRLRHSMMIQKECVGGLKR